jgi:hypothetical protein
MLKNHFFAFFLFIFLCLSSTTHAAFFVPKSIPTQDSPTKIQPTAIQNDPFTAPKDRAGKTVHTHGFLAYFSAACGVVGLLFAAVPSSLGMMLFGLVAGYTGVDGLKKYKHDKSLRTFCYIGIVLGAIAVVFGTIPILLLV